MRNIWRYNNAKDWAARIQTCNTPGTSTFLHQPWLQKMELWASKQGQNLPVFRLMLLQQSQWHPLTFHGTYASAGFAAAVFSQAPISLKSAVLELLKPDKLNLY